MTNPNDRMDRLDHAELPGLDVPQSGLEKIMEQAEEFVGVATHAPAHAYFRTACSRFATVNSNPFLPDEVVNEACLDVMAAAIALLSWGHLWLTSPKSYEHKFGRDRAIRPENVKDECKRILLLSNPTVQDEALCRIISTMIYLIAPKENQIDFLTKLRDGCLKKGIM